MRIDVTKTLTEFDGTEINTPVGGVKSITLCADCSKRLRDNMQPLTLRLVCTRALTVITQKSANLPPEEKFKRGELARKIYSEDNPSLSSGEIETVKKAIGNNPDDSSLIVLQAFELLDPKDEPT